MPGVIFGVIMGPVFYALRPVKTQSFLQSFVYMIFSLTAYEAAVFGSSYIIGFFIRPLRSSPFGFDFFICGVIGGFVMGVFTHFLVEQFRNWKYIFLVALVGGLLAFSYFLFPPGTFAPENDRVGILQPKYVYEDGYLSLFFFWQMGMAGLLGLMTKKGKTT